MKQFIKLILLILGIALISTSISMEDYHVITALLGGICIGVYHSINEKYINK